jgi:hypothetical protein
MTETTEHEMTFAANTTTTTAISGVSAKSAVKVKKKGAKPKLTAKEKKERNVRNVFCTDACDQLTRFCALVDIGRENYLVFAT